MNHIKTLFFLFCTATMLNSTTALADLGRPLKSNEIEVLNSNVKKNPDNIRARLFLAHHYYNIKNWQLVVHYLEPVTEKLQDNDLYKLSRSYLNLRRPRDSDALVNILLSGEKIRARDYTLAAEIYSEIIESHEDLENRRPLIQKLFELLKKGKNEHPQEVAIYDSWFKMAELYLPHYPHEGLRLFDDMKKNKIQLKPEHYSLLCKINFLANFSKGTQESCEEAIKNDPTNPSNYIYLAQNHVNLGEEKKGKRMLASVGRKFSSSEEALWATADSYYKSKDLSSAYKYFKMASSHKDAQARDFLGLAKTAFELNKYGEALVAFTKHCEISEHLDQEFRRASGLLKNQIKWQEKYRQKMLDCRPTSHDKSK